MTFTMTRDLHLRIGIISPFQLRVRRGIESSAGNLATYLANMEQSVTLLCWSGPQTRDKKFIAAGGTYSIMPAIKYLEAMWAAFFYAHAIISLNLDIVIIHFAGYGESAGLALAQLVRQPIVVFTVGYPLDLVPHQFAEFRKYGLAERLSGIVVKAQHMAPIIEQFFGKPTFHIPNGVDIDKFQPNPTHSYNNRKGDTYQLVTVAAIEQRKGFGLILNALPYVIAQIGSVHYTIVGDGPDRNWLEEQIRKLELGSYVSLVGSQSDVVPFLRQADLFLLLSYGEGLPNAYLEALAMGLPTIVSNDPPYNHIAHPDFSVRVDRLNPQAVIEAIVRLLSNPCKRKMMGKAAHKEAEQVYSWPVVASNYLDLFTHLVQAKIED